jgi:glutamine synthetase
VVKDLQGLPKREQINMEKLPENLLEAAKAASASAFIHSCLPKKVADAYVKKAEDKV